jgi:hypothetical protein
MPEHSKAERLADKLDGMVSAKVLPGLLPEDVSAAAAMLRKQDAELNTLRAALATKQHIVNVTAREAMPYSKDIRGEFTIADPRIYYGEIRVDDRWSIGAPQPDWELHVARRLVRAATAEWVSELEEQAYIGVRKAIAMETRRAETAQTGSVAKP